MLRWMIWIRVLWVRMEEVLTVGTRAWEEPAGVEAAKAEDLAAAGASLVPLAVTSLVLLPDAHLYQAVDPTMSPVCRMLELWASGCPPVSCCPTRHPAPR